MEGVGKPKHTTLRAHTVVLTRGPDCLLTSFSADIRSSSSSLIRCSLSGSSWHGCEMGNREERKEKTEEETKTTSLLTKPQTSMGL